MPEIFNYTLAINSILNKVLRKNVSGKRIYSYEKPLLAKTTIETPRRKHEVEKDSMLFLIDDEPEANWAHPCRYVLVDIRTGKLTVIEETFLPTNMPIGKDITSDLKKTSIK